MPIADRTLRRADLGDAEKDLAFALVQLQSGRLPSAFLNAAVALTRIGKHLSETEWKTVNEVTLALLQRIPIVVTP